MVSAMAAPRAPNGFSPCTVESRAVWCSISAFSSAPLNCWCKDESGVVPARPAGNGEHGAQERAFAYPMLLFSTLGAYSSGSVVKASG
jgi:hypothetical protein